MTDVVSEIMKREKLAKLLDYQYCSFRACLYSDIVIFDGSIENNSFEQYQFAYDLMKHLDYVLIISRTDLPYNFEGRRKGGAPSWIKIGENLSKWEDVTDPEQLNTYILEWLKNTLNQLELVGNNKLTKQSSISNIMEELNQLIKQSDKRMEPIEKSSLFISYLSKDFDILKAYFTHIEERTGLAKEGYRYFAPGKVAKEFMTEQRRWEIVSITDREIQKCGSVLIFETEGYYNSWWTMGELVSISYRYQNNWEKCPTIYIAKVYPNGNRDMELTWEVLNTPQQKRDFFPVLSERQKRSVARRFANSDPNEASYELDEKVIHQSQLPSVAKIPLSVMKGITMFIAEKTGLFSKLYDEPSEKNTLLKEISLAWESDNSYTHTREFRTKRIVECKYCRETALSLTIDNFIQLDMPYMYHVDDEELTRRDDDRLILSQKCPVHGVIKLRKAGFYYRFIQPRSGKLMGAQKTLIEQIDRVEFCEM